MANKNISDELYTKLLEVIMVFVIVPKEALKALISSEHYMNRTIKQAIDNGHIKVKDLTVKKGKKEHKKTCFLITVNGVRFLQRTSSLFWIKDIPEMKTFGIFSSKPSNSDLWRMARLAGTTLMCWASGAEVEFPLFGIKRNTPAAKVDEYLTDDDYDDLLDAMLAEWDPFGMSDNNPKDTANPDAENTSKGLPATKEDAKEKINFNLLQYLEDAAARCKKEGIVCLGLSINNFSPRPETARMRFVDSRRMKPFLAKERGLSDDKDVKSGEYIGVLDSTLKSVILYWANSTGMQWKLWSKKTDLRNYETWKWSQAFADPHDLYRDRSIGIMLVRNAEDFRTVYNGTLNDKSFAPGFGAGCDKFYVVPIRYDGAIYLNWLMNVRDSEVEEEIKKRAIHEFGFKLGTSGFNDVFQFDDSAGRHIGIGVYLDIMKLARMRNAPKHEEGEYALICFPWQQEYYSKIFPWMSFITIEPCV